MSPSQDRWLKSLALPATALSAALSSAKGPTINDGMERFGLKSERTHKIGQSTALCSPSSAFAGDRRLETRDCPSGFKREFDPGSESTLAACLTHASRTRKRGQLRTYSGERERKTGLTCPLVGNNLGKPGLIPHNIRGCKSCGSKE